MLEGAECLRRSDAGWQSVAIGNNKGVMAMNKLTNECVYVGC